MSTHTYATVAEAANVYNQLDPDAQAAAQITFSGGQWHLAVLDAHDATVAAMPATREPSALVIDEFERRIDALCQAVYTADASRDRRYKNKYDEAVAFIGAGYPEPIDGDYYPTLKKESAARGVTAAALAELIVARAAAFRAFGAEAEAARAALNVQCPGAVDPRAVAEAIFEPLSQMAGGLA